MDGFLKMIQLSQQVWNEKKGFDRSNYRGIEKKRAFLRLKNMVEDFKSIDWELEFKLLKELYNIPD